MIAAAPMLANVFLSFAAVIGLWALHGVIAGQGAWSPLNRRFLFGLRITMLLFAGRALVAMTGVAGFYSVELLAAAMIPVAILILTEGLLRKHSPRWVKVFVAVAALVFAVWAFWPNVYEPVRWRGLLLYQVGTLAICGAMVVWREKEALSMAENRAVARLGLSIILLVPLVGLDFGAEMLGIPVLLSPLAVLFLCWLAVGLSRSEVGHRESIWGFASVLLSAGLVTTLLAIALSMSTSAVVLTGSVIAAAMLTVAVLNAAWDLRSESSGMSLLRHLAENGDDLDAFLGTLQQHPLVEGALQITSQELPDLDKSVLQGIFAQRPILRKADIHDGGDTEDYASHLFDRFEASHVMLIAEDPMEFMALAMPSVAASSRVETELAVVQRLAVLMARKRT